MPGHDANRQPCALWETDGQKSNEPVLGERRLSNRFTVSVAALVAAGGAVATPQVWAQSGAQDSGSGFIEEIVVTSRRKTELLQDAPATVSVLTEATIENTGARVALDFLQYVPGVSMVAGNVEAGDNQINIRGLNGARDGENNVALVIDGVLKTNVAVLNQDHGAVQQIEVLKGPQGALYGRNAAAGAIVITTHGPTEELSGSARVSVASNDTVKVRGLISNSLSDRLGFVLNGEFAESDGFLRNDFFTTPEARALYPQNTTDPATINNYKTWNANARLVFEPNDTTTIDAKVRVGESTSGAISFNAIFQIPFLAELFGPSFNIDANEHEFIFSPNIDSRNEQSTIDASVKLETEVGDNDLTAYVAYSNVKNFFYADGTSGSFAFFNGESNCIESSTALAGFPVQAPFGIGGGATLPPYSPTTCDGTQYQQTDQEDLSAEIRLAGGDGDFTWQAGAYYLQLDRRVCRNLGLDTGQGVVEQCFTSNPINPTEALIDDFFNTDVFAVFGAIDYNVNDNLTLNLALRYDIEDRDSTNNVPTDVRTRWVGNVLTGFDNGTETSAANYFLNPGLDPAYNPSGVLADRSETFKQLQPKLSFSYAMNDQLNLFGNWGIGFKSGGFNNGGTSEVIEGFFNDQFNAGITVGDAFDKETSSAFEFGLKGSSGDNRVRYEVAGYYTDVDDMQFFGFFVGPFGLLRIVSNMDSVEIYGLEANISANMNDWLTLYLSANVTESEIKENSARPNTVGNNSPYTADYTANAGAEALLPIGNGMDVLLRADYRLTGPTWFHSVQDTTLPNQFGLDGNFNNSQRDSFGILNLRAGISTDRWSVMAFVQNATDEEVLVEVIPAPEFGGSFVAPNQDRMGGIEASWNF